jgi:hypothetical protein
MIVTNDAYFTGTQSHWVIFDVFAGEQGEPIYVPPLGASLSPTAGGPAKTGYRLRLRPAKLHVGQGRLVRFTASVSKGTSKAAGYPGSRIRVAGRTVRTDRRGRASLFLRFGRRGTYTARLLPPHGRRTLARARLRVG